ncbi:ABC transporter ATP-binding protein [Micromonospora sp. NBC_00617]|uniref:ABC transporter ATP-binding protein n=1 Tax=Micromonospora sp. NBC_00617 TaxID=2903587 RepID=UPI0030DF16B6
MNDMVRVVARLIRFDLRRYVLGALFWLPVSVLPLAGGVLLKWIFDRISGGQPVDLSAVWWLCAAFVGAELVRGLTMLIAWAYGVYWWDAAASVLRSNALRSIFTAPGPAADRLPDSSGESLARLRSDVASLVDFADEFIRLAGAVLFTVGALVITVRIDWRISLMLVLPMVAVAVLSTFAARTVKRLHTRAQIGGATVTAYIGEMFSGILTIKTAGADSHVLARLRQHNATRRRAAVRDRLATDLLDAGTGASVEIGIGLVLLLAASAMRGGAFTVGDLALFTTYVSGLTALPRSIGAMLFQVPQAVVATERLNRLLAASETPTDLVRDTRLWFGDTPAPDARPVTTHDDPLTVLEVCGLTAHHDGGTRGVHDVDLRLERGSITVLTGAVGSGKTTLIRAMLGLVPAQAGTIRWNGRPVADPGTFLVPPRVAYAGQRPRLYSATLRENVLLGWPGETVDRALHLAALDEDVTAMPEGLETFVGPRGVRLSGGQIQRATAARALVRAPDLLVLDDLSSALDGETEALFWDRVTRAAREGRGPGTLLVASHRREALERADQVVVLDQGRVVGRGRLGDVLRDCDEMRRLWAEELETTGD